MAKPKKSRQVKKLINEALEVAEYYQEVPVPRGLVSDALTMLLFTQEGMAASIDNDSIKHVTMWLGKILDRKCETQSSPSE